MDVILLDTNIVSFFLQADTRSTLYIPHLENRILAISFMMVAELFQWAGMRNWGKSRTAQLEQFIQTYTILPTNLPLCRVWGQIRATRRAAGHPISPQDAWIAATAIHYEIPLVTHNPADFKFLDNLNLITTV